MVGDESQTLASGGFPNQRGDRAKYRILDLGFQAGWVDFGLEYIHSLVVA